MEKTPPLKTSNKKRRKKMAVPSYSGEDRLSSLPESVLHHILSFMDMREVVQTSFISRNWRYVWASVSVLNFDYSLWKNTNNKKQPVRPYVKRVCRKKGECMDFVDRVLLLRDSSANILKLRLSRHYCWDSGRIDTWLSFAVRRHVKEVYLGVGLNSSLIQLQDFMCSAKIPMSNSNQEVILKIDAATDRISALPDSILHHILSFLEMKEVVKTSLVAVRWRHLWASVPDLKFIHYKSPSQSVRKKVYCRDEYMDFVDKVLFLRDKTTNIRKLHLYGFTPRDLGRIGTWLLCALKRHVKEVHLAIPFPQPELPTWLFNSGIEVFVLKYSSSPMIQIPYSMCSARQLRTLELKSVRLPPCNSEGELALSYPVLENLILINCDYRHLNVLTIVARQLKKLVVANFNVCGPREVKICTPVLTFLKLRGLLHRYILENPSSIVSCLIGAPLGGDGSLPIASLTKFLHDLYNVATLEICGAWDQTPFACKDISSQFLNPFTKLRCLKLIGLDYCSSIHAVAVLLKSCSSIETLVLEVNYCKTSFACKDKYSQLLNPFTKLRCLQLIGLDCRSSIHAVAVLLKSCPYIETLVLEVKNYLALCDTKMEDWGKELSFQRTLFHHLKSVKVQKLKVCENELQFLEFLLKNATVLENITFTPRVYMSKGKELEEFKQKLHSLPKASSSN